MGCALTSWLGVRGAVGLPVESKDSGALAYEGVAEGGGERKTQSWRAAAASATVSCCWSGGERACIGEQGSCAQSSYHWHAGKLTWPQCAVSGSLRSNRTAQRAGTWCTACGCWLLGADVMCCAVLCLAEDFTCMTDFLETAAQAVSGLDNCKVRTHPVSNVSNRPCPAFAAFHVPTVSRKCSPKVERVFTLAAAMQQACSSKCHALVCRHCGIAHCCSQCTLWMRGIMTVLLECGPLCCRCVLFSSAMTRVWSSPWAHWTSLHLTQQSRAW